MDRYSAAIYGTANLQEGTLLKAILEEDPSICLVPKSVEYRKLLKEETAILKKSSQCLRLYSTVDQGFRRWITFNGDFVF